ncbi:Acetyl esterase/lipase [Reichenbachiella faecimaris]|uniref:Acetyl esterase/lipase n=2 Tax=Reichenbachiella faecimaris TaxID=692418 RepID=A0A1W2G7U5_REIFA|nr:Acetyl esterase/lipase [Reichenbachiella faecimaris]
MRVESNGIDSNSTTTQKIMRFVMILILVLLFGENSFSQQTKSLDTANVKYHRDIFYTEAKDSLQSLDVYWNSESKNAKVLLFVHGGGWLSGDKRQYGEMATHLAAQGLTAVVVNYRLSPLVKFPAHTEDVASAINWTNQFIRNYNGDRNKIYLMGHSAGGHLVSLIALDGRYLKKHKLKAKSIQGVLTISAAFEIKPQEGGATKKYLGMVFGDDENVWNQASCTSYVESKSIGKVIPRFLISWGKHENSLITKESLNMMKEFEDNGIKVQTHIFDTKDHYAFVNELKNERSPFFGKVTQFMDHL